MLTLPEPYCTLIGAFAPVVSQRIWRYVPDLVLGAILAPGQRTVASVLRVMGLSRDTHFQNYHRVLNRAVWSSLEAAHLLLGLLAGTFVSSGPLVFGPDDTIERRRGAKLKAKGVYRDPVRSSHGHLVKTSGLRSLSLMLLVPISWAQRVWALPFLTALTRSQRHDETRRDRHKKPTDWGRQMLPQVPRWLPTRSLVVVRRQQLCSDHALAAYAAGGPAHHDGHALPPGCGIARAGATAPARAEGAPAPERQASTHAGSDGA